MPLLLTHPHIFAQKGIYPCVFSASLSKTEPRFLDSGATDHMADNAHLFSSYFPLSDNEKVKTTYGTLSSIAGKGTVVLHHLITLQNVLYVPKMSCNLIFVRRLTRDSQLRLIISHFDC